MGGFSVVLVLTSLAASVALTPPLGWSSWNSFGYAVSEKLIMEMADAIAKSGLRDAGYVYVAIDDGWTACAKFGVGGNCETRPARVDNKIAEDKAKFPHGLKYVTDYIHSLGLKAGIYTAVSASTCGGFMSSLGYEEIDAKTFVEWGFDFVKHDTCNHDCGIHDGCIQNSTRKMGQALKNSGRDVVYYIDDGNSSSGSRVYNPFHHHTSSEVMIKIADKWQDFVWVWGAEEANAHIWKFWFDHHDSWLGSTLDNIHHMIGLEPYQSCGKYNIPDMVTIGQGAETMGNYRAQMFLWSLWSSPILLGNDIRTMKDDIRALLTAPEVLAIDQDKECVQGSLAYTFAGMEVWIKPLSDKTFAVVALNTALVTQNVSIVFNGANGGNFYPAKFESAFVRDVYARKDLGFHILYYVGSVPAEDALMLKISPVI